MHLGLTLEECVQRAYANNMSLRNSRKTLSSTYTYVGEATGIFDPSYYANLTGSETESPSTSAYDRALGINQYDRGPGPVQKGLLQL